MRKSLITMGKYGFSLAEDEAGTGMPWRYLRLGENSLMIRGQTRSFSRKLNSRCWKEQEALFMVEAAQQCGGGACWGCRDNNDNEDL